MGVSKANTITAGFSNSEIKLQPRSTRKIMVSNGKKAALTEFSV
jgi:hypothetical protein